MCGGSGPAGITLRSTAEYSGQNRGGRPGLSVGPDTARQTGEGAKSIRNVGLRGEETRTGLEAGGQGRAREPGNKFLTNYRAESNLWQERRTGPGRISDKVVLQPLSLHTTVPGSPPSYY